MFAISLARSHCNYAIIKIKILVKLRAITSGPKISMIRLKKTAENERKIKESHCFILSTPVISTNDNVDL